MTVYLRPVGHLKVQVFPFPFHISTGLTNSYEDTYQIYVSSSLRKLFSIETKRGVSPHSIFAFGAVICFVFLYARCCC